MCGIVGYIGPKDALDLIVAGLERLEYRGYDSSGIAVLQDGRIQVTRAVGKLAELKKTLAEQGPRTPTHIGIGHTRWATHGRPSEINAHPHTAGRVSLIHNGIIENYIPLREKLSKAGSIFKSETDTEIAAHLLNYHLEKGHSPIDALRQTCAEIRGSYAFVALDADHPDRLLIAKNSTPIVVGMTKTELIVASDIPAVLPITRDVLILEDGDLAEVAPGRIYVEHNGKPVERKPQHISWDAVTAQKGGFKHFMLKEIHDQVQMLAEVFRGRIELEKGDVDLGELTLKPDDVRKLNRIVLVACGSAWHAALVTKFYIEHLAGIPCEVDYASELRYRTPVFDRNTLVVAISQSGETADTLGAIELVRNEARTLAFCNVLGSSLTRKVQDVIFTQAGPEISVASTKAFTTQLVVGYLFALYLGKCRGKLAHQQLAGLVEPLVHLPTAVDEALKLNNKIEEVAKQFSQARDFLFLGRGICYPIALEGALKLKEISYIHAEGYPAGEMKHGPIALISDEMPVVVIMHKSDLLFEKTLSNVREAESRGGKIIAITDAGDHPELRKICKAVIEMPHVSELLSPIVLTIPLQLLAYHVAVLNGTDVDLPRNLAKSVTVE
ncbi:MAG: glutamine--fructose-6-phosphate transaminase (isomerizing) [Oligoflexia bacterium]|nr:glutamine--fructose-6-phosphate transaminase (isomerizing) [Oligoflexia bacterium]